MVNTPGSITIDSVSRKVSNIYSIPDITSLCFTIKVDSTENIFDLDNDQIDVEVTFEFCDPIWTETENLMKYQYIVGQGQMNITISSTDVSFCSDTEYVLRYSMNEDHTDDQAIADLSDIFTWEEDVPRRSGVLSIDTQQGEHMDVYYLLLTERFKTNNVLSRVIVYEIDLVFCPPEFTLPAVKTSVLYLLGEPAIEQQFANADTSSCSVKLANSGSAP